ncbi:clusterin-like protein 1 [Anolis carolinensis]|uniref:Clusterin n=1 Tax=Anolis carolinensis TaxID=28377 RepID=G1KHS7_ANOCA|nr:PREDICTED: clusterin-like protein 1 [Anolis carolinensis]|eukprot:XP_008106858.1 PREDICTED: clusterin-like protein 1 [Anolis carolinensis]
MKSLLILVYLIWVKGHHCVPIKDEEFNDVENLKVLSEVGEKYVDEEVKKALIGIKQMKIMMERNELKHTDLMKTLKKSSEEKEEAVRLMNEVKERLEEEENVCQGSLKNLWGECKSCLESNCMRFYTTCRHGLSTFTRKIEDFFRKMTPLSLPMYELQEKDLPKKEDVHIVQMENLFNQLLSDMGIIFEKSFVFFKQMQKEFDQSFQMYFMSDPDVTEPYYLPSFPEESSRNTGSPKDWEVPGFLQLVFDFSKTILEGVGEVITEAFDEYQESARELVEQIKDSNKSGMFSSDIAGHERTPCSQLRQNLSGCPQFHERCHECQDDLVRVCPNVPELHIKYDDAFKLVNISNEQYQQILQMVQRHTEDTSYLLNKMKERFGWVSELSNMTIGPENIFNIVKVSSIAKGSENSSLNETVVDVNILTSPTFTIKVPQDLDTESSEFIELVAGKALQLYKKNF